MKASTACPGVSYTGTQLCSSRRRASSTVGLAPTQLAIRGGRGRIRTVSTTACAASALEATPVGQFSARIASTLGSPNNMLSASA
jgi:hypothetical protein